MSRYGPRTRTTGSALTSHVAQWGKGPIIKSIQQGSIDLNGVTTNFATLSPAIVNLKNAVLRWGGMSNASSAKTATDAFATIALTNVTTVTALSDGSVGSARPVLFTIIEYEPGVIRSIQYGNTGVTSTITAVVVAKSEAIFLGQLSDGAADDLIGTDFASIKLNSSTAVLKAGSTSGAVSFSVVEYY